MAELFDYLESRDDADELIAEFGQAVTLRRTVPSGPAYDPTLTSSDYATKGAKIEFTLRQLQGGSVLATDERWLVAAGPLTALGITSMQPPDVIVVGSTPRQVIKADTLSPAGTVVMFDCQCRK